MQSHFSGFLVFQLASNQVYHWRLFEWPSVNSIKRGVNGFSSSRASLLTSSFFTLFHPKQAAIKRKSFGMKTMKANLLYPSQTHNVPFNWASTLPHSSSDLFGWVFKSARRVERYAANNAVMGNSILRKTSDQFPLVQSLSRSFPEWCKHKVEVFLLSNSWKPFLRTHNTNLLSIFQDKCTSGWRWIKRLPLSRQTLTHLTNNVGIWANVLYVYA